MYYIKICVHAYYIYIVHYDAILYIIVILQGHGDGVELNCELTKGSKCHKCETFRAWTCKYIKSRLGVLQSSKQLQQQQQEEVRQV
jgi:hypothetical protein